jgi:malonyl-CoA/methylmalonyl-CoA synthetase
VGTAAVVDPSGSWSREQVIAAARSLAGALDAVLDRADPNPGPCADPPMPRLHGIDVGPRVVLLCEPGRAFLNGLLACWEAGAVAVPFHPSHPLAELGPMAAEAGARAVLCSPAHRDLADAIAGEGSAPVPVLDVDAHRNALERGHPGAPTDEPPADRAALMVFTSGTTGRPKGVLHTHGSVRGQVEALLGPWGWTPTDRALLVLPLHHVHGIMAVVLCAWAAEATCEAPGGFDPVATWERFAAGGVTIFMAVPTIYARLIGAWEGADEPTRRRWSDGARALRLMVSGSAALPVSVLDRWRALTGHTLLERYGMTEFGLALSNTLTHREPGHVGMPLPGFEVRRVDDDGALAADEAPGEIQVRGDAVFAAYWNRPAATDEAFTDDGWFRTGDVGLVDAEGYRLLGRSSVDIIKTGGEKVSAVEIEETYRRHPAIADAAVVGVPDDEWGQQVAIVTVPAAGVDPAALDPVALRAWGKQQLAPAKVPVRFLVADSLPRNAMGKVTKHAVIDRFLPPTTRDDEPPWPGRPGPVA